MEVRSPRPRGSLKERLPITARLWYTGSNGKEANQGRKPAGELADREFGASQPALGSACAYRFGAGGTCAGGQLRPGNALLAGRHPYPHRPPGQQAGGIRSNRSSRGPPPSRPLGQVCVRRRIPGNSVFPVPTRCIRSNVACPLRFSPAWRADTDHQIDNRFPIRRREEKAHPRTGCAEKPPREPRRGQSMSLKNHQNHSRRFIKRSAFTITLRASAMLSMGM